MEEQEQILQRAIDAAEQARQSCEKAKLKGDPRLIEKAEKQSHEAQMLLLKATTQCEGDDSIQEIKKAKDELAELQFSMLDLKEE
ncbi:hypothetical protein JOD45_001658 [Scopulibacillus daqui]|uniref:Uncharacterized protein n=1 Tax=Scopulibacillus daqui TaxID=1469162 RepID=A0ABS2PZI0_9BACL|nr:hypothetical protein [Scopulibacillus daqui]MBM7645447.1 hypothetical protein [Scopulibacillus daqui]